MGPHPIPVAILRDDLIPCNFFGRRARCQRAMEHAGSVLYGKGNTSPVTNRGIGWLIRWGSRRCLGAAELILDEREFLRVERALVHHFLVVLEQLVASRRHVLCGLLAPTLQSIYRPCPKADDGEQGPACH